jgi:ubiquitin C-terminal hydrolase
MDKAQKPSDSKCNRPLIGTLKIVNVIFFYHRFDYREEKLQKIDKYVDFQFHLDVQRHLSLTNQKCTRYTLYAMSNHHTLQTGGHYTAHCRNEYYNRWYKFDDDKVSVISKKIRSKDAYVLFYAAVD